MSRQASYRLAADRQASSDESSEEDTLLQPTHQNAALSPLLLRKLLLRMIPVLWLGYVLNIVDRTNLGYAQLQMEADLHTTPSVFGLASGIFFVGYALMQVPSNHAIPRLGARRVLSACMLMWGLLSTSTGFIQSASQLCTLRLMLGLSEAGFYPGVLLFFSRWFPEGESAKALAWFATAASVGGLVSSAGSGWLMWALDGAWGVRGWRWLLVVQGLPSVFLGLAVPCLLSESPSDARWLAEGEKRELMCAMRSGGRNGAPMAELDGSDSKGHGSQGRPGTPEDDADASAAPDAHFDRARAPSLLGSLRAACRLSITTRFALQYISISVMTNSARFFLPSLLRDAFPTLEPWQIGLAFALPAAIKVVLQPMLGAIADAGGRHMRFRVAWGACALSACLILASAAVMRATGSPMANRQGGAPVLAALSIACLALADVATNCAIPVLWSLHHTSVPRQLHGVSIALVNSVGNLGGFVGPSALGWIHDYTSASACPRHARAAGVGCIARWAPGVATLGVLSALITLMTGRQVQRLLVGTGRPRGARPPDWTLRP